MRTPLGTGNDNPAVLRYFAIGETEQRVSVDEAAAPLAVYRSPGMHLVLTPKDREFLRKLGIGSDLR